MPGVIRIGLMQPLGELAPYGGGKRCAVLRAVSRRSPTASYRASSNVVGEASAPVTPAISPSAVVWEHW
ncbi:hypothetical protein ACF1A5_06150 [Streptomyces sp. NPDC014864]|uniref:hypothetical protein n=1 Tax=Streptomyces sp. NPDC014864 TaxID=3364924 RepID=UPI0036F809A2